ncbi:salicylate hydroxylase [Trichoderma cornu-damae]|uniref:Salicylate hydroxylase n=1 Tax=Trichoderma cornu-damae TaxID=654480 RepID=A0A9P8QPB1_9HYPO|nr:salicylate hydroxylase [Trichoderma cornu-damae]
MELETKPAEPTIIIYERDAQDVAPERETYTLSLTGFDSSAGLAAETRPWDQIARNDVRQVFHHAFDLGHQCVLHWGSQCVSATQLLDSRLRVRMICGNAARESEQDCDLLIAADGANSKLRRSLRPDDRLCCNGAVFKRAARQLRCKLS